MGGSSAGSSGSSDAPTTRKHTVTQVREKKSILDSSPTVQLVKGVYKSVTDSMTNNKLVGTSDYQGGGITGMAVRAVKGAIDKRNPRSNINDPTGLYAEGLTTGSRNNNNMSGGDSGNDTAPTQVATNVGGTIVTAPSSAEVSQSNAADVTYDSRKTKAKGRSMTILTSARGVRNNTNAVLGTKSLLGRA